MSPIISSNLKINYQTGLFDRTSPIRIAVSAKFYEFPEKFIWLAASGFDLEYTPDADNLKRLPEHIEPFLSRGVAIRYHAFFPGHEIGNHDPDAAEKAMALHFQMIDLMQGRGEPIMTAHIGLVPAIEIDPARAVKNLGRLVQYGRDHGVTVSLENLKHGPSSHPETVLDWTAQAGAAITLDIGHLLSCERVRNGTLDPYRVIDMFAPRLIEVHYYEKETDHHHAPRDMSILGPIVDRLQAVDCSWWTIELEPREEILRSRELLFEYLESETGGGASLKFEV